MSGNRKYVRLVAFVSVIVATLALSGAAAFADGIVNHG